MPSLAQARKIEPLEFKSAESRKRIDKRWMHMSKSFDYYDYDFIDDMGFGHLRVIDAFEMPYLTGTPVHPHKDMEILTIILEGQVFHQDSLGHSGILHAGDYQLMSAGKGLKHAETNPSQFQTLKGLQIWISSNNTTGEAKYSQILKKDIDINNNLALIASANNKNGMIIHNDVYIYRGQFTKKTDYNYRLKNKEHGVYIQMITGSIKVFEQTLNEGDGLGIAYKNDINLHITANSDFILFEVPLQGKF